MCGRQGFGKGLLAKETPTAQPSFRLIFSIPSQSLPSFSCPFLSWLTLKIGNLHDYRHIIYVESPNFFEYHYVWNVANWVLSFGSQRLFGVREHPMYGRSGRSLELWVNSYNLTWLFTETKTCPRWYPKVKAWEDCRGRLPRKSCFCHLSARSGQHSVCWEIPGVDKMWILTNLR